MIKICNPWCGACSADHECIHFDHLSNTRLMALLRRGLVALTIKLDSEDCAANGWQHLPLQCGLYDA